MNGKGAINTTKQSYLLQYHASWLKVYTYIDM